MWERDETLPEVIDEAWTSRPECSSLDDLIQKIECTNDHLKEWSTAVFGKVSREIRNLRKKLNKLWKKPSTDQCN
jgi:hypothetical protein